MRRTITSRLPLAFSTMALLIAVTGVAPAEAVRAVKRALSAKNAEAVDGVSASRTPKPGHLLPLDADGRFPQGVLSQVRGARGPAGPMGEAGPRGASGTSTARFASGPRMELPRTMHKDVQVARMDNLPAGKWLLWWSAGADYEASDATSVACRLTVPGNNNVADVDVVVGQGPNAALALSLGSSAATDQSASFDVTMRCVQNHEIAPTVKPVFIDSQRIVAVRVDALEVTGG